MNDTLTRLPHSGLQVPAEPKLAITSYRGHNTSDGVSFVATLRADGHIIGQVENAGTGGGTIYYPRDFAFDYAWFNAYVAKCLDDEGNQPLPESVLDDLITEYELGRETAKLAKQGRTLLRLMDYIFDGDDRPSGGAYMTHSAGCTTPANNFERATLRASVLRKFNYGSRYSWWQIWTGEAWEDLTERPQVTA